MRIWSTITTSLENGVACALVTVAGAKGSTPREHGARMVVLPDGRYSGTIGGGTLEFQVIRWARAALESGKTGLELRYVSLGPDLGQCCGGRVDVAIEALEPAQLPMARNLAELEAAGRPFATSANVTDGQAVRRDIIEPSGEFRFTLSGDGKLTEVFGVNRRPLHLFGAGHVGKALVLALAPLPFEITWIDSRADVFPAAVPANVRKVLMDRDANTAADLLAQAPSEAFVLAMTHSHALDEKIMAAALSAQRFDYCGVIGSATKRARFEKRLQTRGLAPSLVQAMVCPVGNPAIRSKQPAVIAAGVVVDLLQRDEAMMQMTVGPEASVRHQAIVG